MKREDRKKLKASLINAPEVVARWQARLASHEYNPTGDIKFSVDKRSISGFVSDDVTNNGRRDFNINLLGILIAAVGVPIGLSEVVYEAISDHETEEANELTDRQVFSVDHTYAADLTEREYNDPKFNFAAPASLNLGMAALHNSFYFAKTGDISGLISNLQDLNIALDNTVDSLSRAAILSRIAVNNILLGRAQSAREATRKINLNQLDRGTIAYSKSLDLISTASLSSLDRRSLRNFSGFDAETICRNWMGINDLTTANVKDFLDQADMFMSSVSCAVQAKWIRKIQLARSASNAQLGQIRRAWVDEMVRLITSVESRPYALLMAEDFHYWLCRPAFHALRCHDFKHLEELMSLHFEATYLGKRLAPHVVQAGVIIKNKRPPNTQWMFLLKIVSEMLKLTSSGHEQARQTRLELFQSSDCRLFKIQNTTISKAATDVTIGLANDRRAVAEVKDLVNGYWPIPDVGSNMGYYNLIRAAALNPRDYRDAE